MYLEIPVNAVFSFNVGDGNIFFGAGPYYGFGIGGKIKLDGVEIRGDIKANEKSERDVKFGNDELFKRGDFGLNFLAGYQLRNGFNLHAGYGLGLKTITGRSVEYYQEKIGCSPLE